MSRKKISTSLFHKLFRLMPDCFLHPFGTCKKTCAGLAEEEDLDSLSSLKVKTHLTICSKCWNYYHQMKIINKKIIESLKYEVNAKSAPIENEKKTIANLVSRFSTK